MGFLRRSCSELSAAATLTLSAVSVCRALPLTSSHPPRSSWELCLFLWLPPPPHAGASAAEPQGPADTGALHECSSVLPGAVLACSV